MADAGWYPDPESDQLRYWDGQQWLDIPPPPPSVPSPPTMAVAPPPKLGYDAQTDTFTGSLPKLMRIAVRAVESLRWTVVSANDSVGLLTFETKMSLGSWSGVTCTLSFDELQPGTWRIAGSGKQNVRGGQLGAMDFGEAKRKAEKAIKVMRDLAVESLPANPAATPEGWFPDPSGRHPDRWWNGAEWTHWVRDKPGGTRSEDPPVA